MPRPVSPVKTALARQGITQVEMAELLHISPRVLRNALNEGPTWPRLRHDLADLLQVDEAELFPEHAEPPTGTAA